MNASYRIEAVVPGTSNAIRSHDHPMLEAGNLSFPDGRYLLDFAAGADRSSYVITHRIEGAPLISSLLEEEKALYACIVSSPISSYRETHTSTSPKHEVSWNVDDLGEAPMFTPAVLCTEAKDVTLSAARDGVHPIWDDQAVSLHKGSRLALGSVIQLESSILHLLSFHKDPALAEGRFKVDLASEPFRFRVDLSPGLHRFLRYSGSEGHHNIMTHVVTACLARLQRDYPGDDGDSGWRSHRNLIALADYLEQRELGHWSDDTFRPEEVATALYPLKVSNGAPAGTDGDEGA